uniref:Uncharacterized protein n=1 Tax=Molossus molossus TaxID=27622 RepID=A0A7J8J7X7_MOLMO|nr:hypothetical protein HJG59_009657 [Molossus molossus]
MCVFSEQFPTTDTPAQFQEMAGRTDEGAASSHPVTPRRKNWTRTEGSYWWLHGDSALMCPLLFLVTHCPWLGVTSAVFSSVCLSCAGRRAGPGPSMLFRGGGEPCSEWTSPVSLVLQSRSWGSQGGGLWWEDHSVRDSWGPSSGTPGGEGSVTYGL